MVCYSLVSLHFFFFFNDTATTEIYTLSLHDALPISSTKSMVTRSPFHPDFDRDDARSEEHTSELQSPYVISYAVFCLKKKKNHDPNWSKCSLSGISNRTKVCSPV